MRVVSSLLLDASVVTGVEENKPVWVQVAQEGNFAGYSAGAFKFDQAVFDQIIKNFRQHPAYAADAAGVGASAVVPWDFHHASEMNPTSGTIPQEGAPAQGWVYDLTTKVGADGKVQLWAYTLWLEPARTYVKEGRYRWSSVTVLFHSIDPITGADTGANLTSIALTNKPFIEGMTPLAAERTPHEARLGYYYYDAAQSPKDALEKLRSLFSLASTAGIGDVLKQIALIQEWVASGAAPLGVELDELVGAMRKIFNLPALSLNDEVFAAGNNLLTRLLEEEALKNPEPPAPAPTPPADPAPALMENKNMTILKALASRYRVQENDSAVLEAVDASLAFRISLCKHLQLSPNVVDAVVLEGAAKAMGAADKLGAILKALGIEDSAGAVDKIAGMFTQVKELEALMPELKELREAKAAAEDKEIEEDAEKAAASKPGYAQLDPTFKAAVISGLKLERKTLGKPKFLEKHPLPNQGALPGSQGAHLLTSFTQGKLGGETRLVTNPDGTLRLEQSGGRANAGEQPLGAPKSISLAGHQGRNKTERVISWVKAQNPKLDWDGVTAEAHGLVSSGVQFTD
jgi:hypothetical protein